MPRRVDWLHPLADPPRTSLQACTSGFAGPYRKIDNFAMARRLHDHWTSRADSLSPGDEYDLVDEFDEMFCIRGWYDWIPDDG